MAETSKISRNEPCPCGSGKKYKSCCVGKTAVGKKSYRLPLIITLIGLIAGGVVFSQSTLQNGAMAFAVAVVFAVGIYIVADPPESRGRGGGGQINFGN